MQKHSRYFEGILQLRNPREEVNQFIKSELEKKPEIFISQTIKHRTGLDIYFSSKKFLQGLGRQLQQKFGGELKISAEHFSRDRQTSKDMFRVNVLYRFTGIKSGNVINFRGDELTILSTGKNIHAVNRKTGKKSILKHKDILSQESVKNHPS